MKKVKEYAKGLFLMATGALILIIPLSFAPELFENKPQLLIPVLLVAVGWFFWFFSKGARLWK